MHRCSSSQGNMMGQCSCGLYQCQNNNSSSSWLFSMPNHTSYDETNMYSFMSSSVDCTLSLGTPSTRLCEDDDNNKHISSGSSNYCWDLLQQNNKAPSYTSHQTTKAGRGGSNGNTSTGNDSLLARRCANCDTTSTPLWRNGPRGPKSLCNACGIRFKKEERRATTANANNNSSMLEHQQQYRGYDYNYHNSWVQDQKMPCFSPLNEFRFIEGNHRDSDTGIPYLSGRLNVADRPTSLVHDFTR